MTATQTTQKKRARRSNGASEPPSLSFSLPDDLSHLPPMAAAIEIFERAYLLHVLRLNGGNRIATASSLGINRTYLYTIAKRLGIEMQQPPNRANKPRVEEVLERAIEHHMENDGWSGGLQTFSVGSFDNASIDSALKSLDDNDPTVELASMLLRMTERSRARIASVVEKINRQRAKSKPRRGK